MLLVDEDQSSRLQSAHALMRSGVEVSLAADGHQALLQLGEHHFDVVVSDLDAEGVGGLELVRRIRLLDLDLPVVLLVADPGRLDAVAIRDDSAFAYLSKPATHDDLARAVTRAALVYQLASARRGLVYGGGDEPGPTHDLVGLEARLDLALSRLFIVHEPVVRWPEREPVGSEASARSEEPALPGEDALRDAAERLGRSEELGRRLRWIIAAEEGPGASGPLLFVDVALTDLLDEALFERRGPFTTLARRVVLQVSERAALHRIADLRERVRRLRELGFSIALDDVGAGYGGLDGFAKLEPDFVKLHPALVRAVPRRSTTRRLVRATLEACSALGVAVVATGVEQQGERDVLTELGCGLMQGPLFGRPRRRAG